MSETVSKTKSADTIKSDPRKTQTNWRVLEEGGFIPVRVRCDGYKANHPSDLSCHTNVQPTSENVLRHMASDHGGGWFKFRFRLSDSGKSSPLWRELENAGVECAEFYCPHCRENVPFTPRRIVYHLNQHPGANRINLNPQTLCMTLTTQRADEDESSYLYDEVAA